MKGKIIVIEGADGAGKTTQFNALCQRLETEGQSIVRHKFPSYGKPQASLIEMYLSGVFKKNAEDIDYKVTSTFFAVDRCTEFMLNLQEEYNKGKILMLDRYTTSNMIHQVCKLNTKREINHALKWLTTFEFRDLKLPKPDIVFYLNISDNFSESLIKNRIQNDGIKKDIHEINPEYLKKVRRCGLYCAQKYNWEIINCIKDDKLRSIEDIHEEIYIKFKKKFKNL